MVTFVIWKWFSPTYRHVFTAEHVNVFAAMLRRGYQAQHRLICLTDDAAGIDCETQPVWSDFANLNNPSGPVLPSCYRRLRIFDGATTRSLGIADGDRVVSMDLDVVLMGDLVPLFEGREEAEFVGWRGIGVFNPWIYNGSLFMFRAGRLQRWWDEFDPETTPQQTRDARYFGSDQAYMSYRLNGSAPGWDVGDGVYSFARDFTRTYGFKEPPANARAIFFNGKRKPWEKVTQDSAPWIARHWRA